MLNEEPEALQEEVGAIGVIYPECIRNLAPLIYIFKVPQHEHIEFQMSFPLTYPEEKPCILDVISTKEGFDDAYLMELFSEVLDSIFHKGDVAIFDLFTELDQVLYSDEEDNISVNEDHWTADDAIDTISAKVKGLSLREASVTLNTPNGSDVTASVEIKKGEEEEKEEEEVNYSDYVYDEEKEKSQAQQKKSSNSSASTINPFEGWSISDPVVDRKSTFVAFAKEVHSVDEAYEYLGQLLSERKVAKSNHAMRAWRIKNDDKEVTYQDCDDDGETAAGGRMLHLLNVMDAWNVMVVCVRWFGGVHIGPDRFKHINSTTRESVVKGGFISLIDSKSKTKVSKKKK